MKKWLQFAWWCLTHPRAARYTVALLIGMRVYTWRLRKQKKGM